MSSSSAPAHPPLEASSEPFKTYTPAEKKELSSAEAAASSTWQTWHDAKAKGTASPEEIQRLLEIAEARQDELKGLQSLC